MRYAELDSFSPLQIEEGSATIATLIFATPSGFSPLQIEEGSATTSRRGWRSCRTGFSPLQIEEGSATLTLIPVRASPRHPGFQSSPNRGRVRDGERFLPLPCSLRVSVLSKSRKGPRPVEDGRGRRARIWVSVLSKSRKGPRQNTVCQALLWNLVSVLSKSRKGPRRDAPLKQRFSPLQIEEGSATQLRDRQPANPDEDPVSVLSKSRKGPRLTRKCTMAACTPSPSVSVLSKSRKGPRQCGC